MLNCLEWFNFLQHRKILSKIKLINKKLKLIKLKLDKIKNKSSLKGVKEVKLYKIYSIFIIHILIKNICLDQFWIII